MLHIFRVNNYTTYVVAKMVIHQKGLAYSRCRFLTARNLETLPEDSSRTTISPYKYQPDPFPAVPKFWTGRQRLRQLDLFVDRLSNRSKFAYYATNYSRKINQFFATHKLCREINFLEEGTACYYSRAHLEELYAFKGNWKSWLVTKCNYGARVKNWGFVPRPALDNYYTLTNHALPGYRTTNVFSGEAFATQFPQHALKTHADKSEIILVLDSLATLGYISTIDHIDAVIKAISRLKSFFSNYEPTIYLKFHPVQSAEERLAFRATLSNEKLNVVYLQDNLVLEGLVFNKSKHVFVGNCSSILLYAGIFGKTAISFSSLLPASAIPKLPSLYWKYVSQI